MFPLECEKDMEDWMGGGWSSLGTPLTEDGMGKVREWHGTRGGATLRAAHTVGRGGQLRLRLLGRAVPLERPQRRQEARLGGLLRRRWPTTGSPQGTM